MLNRLKPDIYKKKKHDEIMAYINLVPNAFTHSEWPWSSALVMWWRRRNWESSRIPALKRRSIWIPMIG